jgi:type I restriction enzyme M protein
MGSLVDRKHRELSEAEIIQLSRTYHAWRGEKEAGKYADIPGFCKSALVDEIAAHGHILTPGRYVGAKDREDDDEVFDEKMRRLTAKLHEQFRQGEELQERIILNLDSLENAN